MRCGAGERLGSCSLRHLEPELQKPHPPRLPHTCLHPSPAHRPWASQEGWPWPSASDLPPRAASPNQAWPVISSRASKRTPEKMPRKSEGLSVCYTHQRLAGGTHRHPLPRGDQGTKKWGHGRDVWALASLGPAQQGARPPRPGSTGHPSPHCLLLRDTSHEDCWLTEPAF